MGSSIDWVRLAQVQESLRSLEAGEAAPEGAVERGRGVRLRLARRRLEEGLRSQAMEEASRRREEFEAALQRVTARAARWAVATPVDPAPAPAPPPPRAVARRPAPAPQQTAAPGVAGRAAAPARAAAAPVAAPAKATAPPTRHRRRPKAKPGALPEFWSPTVALGFRLWELRGRLQGAWKAWDQPEYEARCLSAGHARDDGEVPHTDGRCGHPPCGIYCFKEAEQLVAAFGLPSGPRRYVLGLVALSGKVVEHERGYRARRARVLAAAVVGRGRIVRVAGRERLLALFRDPEATVERLMAEDPSVVEQVGEPVRAAEGVISYLTLARDGYTLLEW